MPEDNFWHFVVAPDILLGKKALEIGQFSLGKKWSVIRRPLFPYIFDIYEWPKISKCFANCHQNGHSKKYSHTINENLPRTLSLTLYIKFVTKVDTDFRIDIWTVWYSGIYERFAFFKSFLVIGAFEERLRLMQEYLETLWSPLCYYYVLSSKWF